MVIIIIIQFLTVLVEIILNEQAVLWQPYKEWNRIFFEDCLSLFAVHLHLFYCNLSRKYQYGFSMYTANLVEKTLLKKGGN